MYKDLAVHKKRAKVKARWYHGDAKTWASLERSPREESVCSSSDKRPVEKISQRPVYPIIESANRFLDSKSDSFDDWGL